MAIKISPSIGRYMRRSAMGSWMGMMLEVGASSTRKTKITVAGQGKAAAVPPGNRGQRQQSGQAENCAMLKDGVRDGKVPIHIQIDGQHEVDHVGEKDAELSEQVLIPGEVLHGEAGAAAGACSGDQPPEERNAAGGAHRQVA